VGTEGVLLGGPGCTSDLWAISTLFGDRTNVKRGNSGQNESTKEAMPFKIVTSTNTVTRFQLHHDHCTTMSEIHRFLRGFSRAIRLPFL
jgi:hypothetical protein